MTELSFPLHPEILAMSDEERRALARDLIYDPHPGANLQTLAQAHAEGGKDALGEKYNELFPASVNSLAKA